MNKKHIIVLLLSLVVTLAHASTLPDGLPQQADSAYRVGNYKQAVEYYEQILANDLESADLHYNLGNAYYRLGQMGPAILHYERALRLRPAFSDARENLAIANNHITDRITTLPRLFIVKWYEALISRLSPAVWRTIVVLLFALAAAAAVVLILSRNLSLRKGAFATLLSSGVLLVLAVLLLIASTSRFNNHSSAIVLEPSIVVKSSPEQESADKLILHEGTKVTIADHLSGWYKITIADGTTGWCLAEGVERI